MQPPAQRHKNQQYDYGRTHDDDDDDGQQKKKQKTKKKNSKTRTEIENDTTSLNKSFKDLYLPQHQTEHRT